MTFLWVFLPTALLLYMFFSYFGKNRGGNMILLLASLIFYAWGEPLYVFLLLASVLINYIFGLLLGGEKDSYRKFFLILSVVFNVGVLGFFKYFNSNFPH